MNLEALFNYTAQQQGITPELARQNWESNFGPAISVDPLDMGSGQGALGELSAPTDTSGTIDPLNPSSTRKPFPTAGENLTDEEYQQRIKDIYHNAGLPAPGEPGYDPSADPFPVDLPVDYVPPEINPLTGEPQQADLTSDPVAEDLGEDGSPQPTQKKLLYGSDYSLEDVVGGQVERLYFSDPTTGKAYDYDYDDQEWQYGAPPSDFANLTLTGAIGKDKGTGDKFRVNIDPLQYGYGGAATPALAADIKKQSLRDDPSDNDIWYTDPQGVQRVDVSGTGQSIPVGSTNITRDPTQLGYMEKVADPQIGDDEGTWIKRDIDPRTYTSPVLTKHWSGYMPVDKPDRIEYSHVKGDDYRAEHDNLFQNLVKGYQAFSGTPTSEGIKSDRLLIEGPEAKTSWKDFFSIGPGKFDLGQKFGMDEGKLVLSNPPSDRFNLEPFFNQTEAYGMDNFVRSQQRDVLKSILGREQELPLEGDKGLEKVLGTLQGLDDNDPKSGIDSGYQIDPFDTDSESQVASITGDDEADPEDTTPYKVNAYKGGLGPYARNWIFQRYGYDTEKIDWDLTYDPVQELYFFPNGEAVDPKLLEGVKFTRLDEDGEPVETSDASTPDIVNNPIIGSESTTPDIVNNPIIGSSPTTPQVQTPSSWSKDMTDYFTTLIIQGDDASIALDKTMAAFPDYENW